MADSPDRPDNAPQPALADAAASVVVMGVSGCGKSTVGAALAQALALPFIEGDTLHPPRNVALMAAGTPLTDDDRQGWLEAIAQRLADAQASAPAGVVVSCSALKRRYRDLLRSGAPGLRLVYLHGAPELLAQRMRSRPDHYMPPSLLPSQLQALEPPLADESPICVDIALPPETIVQTALRALQRPGPRSPASSVSSPTSPLPSPSLPSPPAPSQLPSPSPPPPAPSPLPSHATSA